MIPWATQVAVPDVAGHSRGLVIGTGLVALLLGLAIPALQRSLTPAHEGSHAIVALLVGASVKRVTFGRSGNAETHVVGGGWPAGLLIALAGYLGPSLFGLAGALALARDAVPAVLFGTLVLLVLLLAVTRTIVGLATVLPAIGFFFMVAWYGPARLQTPVAFTWVWFLLIGGLIHVIRYNALHWSARRVGHKGAGDALFLRNATFVPAFVWILVFFAGTLAALVIGASILFAGGPI